MKYEWDFENAVQFVLQKEGGYVNHPNDPGGETNFGISKRAYPDVDIANLTAADAIAIYHRDYWQPVAEEISDPTMRLVVFDAAVNHGVNRALKWAKQYDTPLSFMAKRFKFWAGLQTFKVFGAGWVNRGADVLAEMDRQENDLRFIDVIIDHRPMMVRMASAITGRSSSMLVRTRPLSGGSGLKMDVREVE